MRDLIESGILVPGDPLPPVRVLARRLEVNRNTVVAAYGLLARSGAVIGQGRAGTRVAEHTPVAQEGYVATGTGATSPPEPCAMSAPATPRRN